ncbi:MAG: DUF4214 domain-containing protein [Acidimicrobiales bacterium]
MGPRTRLLVALLCVAAALAGPAAAQMPGSSAPEDDGLGLAVERVDVTFDDGWIVPDLAESAAEAEAATGTDDHEGHSHGVPIASAGAGAVGASVDLDGAQQMVVLDTHGRSGAFALRSRTAGEWSPWIELTTAADEAPDSNGEGAGEGAGAGLPAVGPIWVGDDTDAVELVRLDGDDAPIAVELLAADRAAIAASLDEEPAAADTAVPSAALASQPTIQPRSAWATRGWAFANDTCEDGPVLARNVDAMVVHHTVTANTYAASDVPALIRGVYRTHVDVNGWCDVAYNFMVDRFGRIWETRTDSIAEPVISGATKGFNTATVSVGVIAQYQGGASPASVTPPQVVIDAVADLGAWKLGLHGVDPLGEVWLKSRTSATTGLRFADGTWVRVPTIVGHRDLGLTSCPGSRFYPSLPAIRAAIATDRSLAVDFPSRQPLDSGPAVLAVDAQGRLRPAGAAETPPSSLTVGGSAVTAIAARDGRGFAVLDSGSVVGFGGFVSPASNPMSPLPAIDIEMDEAGTSAWVIDRNGRLRGVDGGAGPALAGSLPAGREAVAFAMASDDAGYLVDDAGGIHVIGTSPTVTSPSLGGATAVDLALRRNGVSGWVLASDGRLHAFGGAPARTSPLAGTADRARAVMVDPFDRGGWVLDSEGQLHAFGRPRQIQPVSTTVGTGTIVDGALWWELPNDLGETDDSKYVAAVLELFLGRSPSLRELDELAWDIDYRSRAQVVDELANSPEWAGVILDDIYLDVLGRTPDASGQAYWLDRLQNGMRTQELGAEFYASPEYVAAAGSTDAWLTEIYDALLHRRPDAQGLAYWRARLAEGTTPIEVTTGFYNSIESRSDRVARLYDRVLGRAPDAEGLAFWAERLLVTDDDIALARNLAISGEFYDRSIGE